MSELTLSINPPPQDRRCEGCGKHTSELEPFPKIDEEDEGGILLMRGYRCMSPRIPEMDEKVKKLKTPEDWENLEKENKEEYESISFYEQLISTVGASWECKECFKLDDDEFYKIQNERYKKEADQSKVEEA